MTTNKLPELKKENSFTSFLTPYSVANLAAKTTLIYSVVALATKPWQAMLTQVQYGLPISLSGGFYRGFLSFAVSNHKRGALAFSHKQKNQLEEDEVDVNISSYKSWIGTISFSQADLIISNGLRSKANLEYAEIITKNNFKWSLRNLWKLTTVNWGARSLAGLINFSAIGAGGNYITSFYNFDNEINNQLLGGATSGLFATFLTTLPNAFGDRQVLASRMENQHLVTVSNLTMFKRMNQHMANVGSREAITTYLKAKFFKEFLLRSSQNMITFSIIFGLDYALGLEPLKNIWPQSQNGFKTLGDWF